MEIKYKLVCESYPELSRVVRDALMSSVTNSIHKSVDRKEVMKALNKFKKKRRLLIIEKFIEIEEETHEFPQVIPNVVKFFFEVSKIIS